MLDDDLIGKRSCLFSGQRQKIQTDHYNKCGNALWEECNCLIGLTIHILKLVPSGFLYEFFICSV
jgi:hypothetical protein